MLFDNLEYLSIENQTTDFPKHFHETFCISLIHEGIERIDFDGQSFFSEAGHITITNPYEIHSNPLIDQQSRVKFDTLYISSDVVKYIAGGKHITFLNRKIKSDEANHLFEALKVAMDRDDAKAIDQFLHQFITALLPYAQEHQASYSALNFKHLERVNEYIEHHIEEKLTLEALARVANLNKYGFAKKFKASTGMTPMNYILMKKIFASKGQIGGQSELTDLAYQYNFTDLAHFSKTFKRYIGISPKVYQIKIGEKS